jgi:hypothetical protein
MKLKQTIVGGIITIAIAGFTTIVLLELGWRPEFPSSQDQADTEPAMDDTLLMNHSEIPTIEHNESSQMRRRDSL